MKQVLRLLSLCLTISFFTTSLFTQTYNRTTDSLALVALYTATDGPNWTNTWELQQPMSSWYGITLNANGRVIRIDLDGDISPNVPRNWLDGNNLEGTIPAEIWTLTQLKELSLSRNKLSGTLSASIANLKELEVLSLLTYFDINPGLSGNIPNEIGSLSKLKYLLLGENEFSGPIPASINQLTNLLYLSIEYNNLTDIPNLSALTNLQTLRMGGNPIAPMPIPEWMYELKNLEDLFADDLNFTGEISPKIGQLSKLSVLAIRGNNLTGTIPIEIGGLNNLHLLLLDNNQLSGSIPPAIAMLNLGRFIVSNNNLSGLVPNFSINSERLYDIDIENNAFTFEDILPHFAAVNALNLNLEYDYCPQQKVYEPTIAVLKPQDSYTIDLGIDENVNSNAYVWYKDGQFLSRIVGSPQLVFPTLRAADAGIYYCEVTNPTIPGLILESHTITIQITDNACRQRDSLALVDLYNSANGTNWFNTWNLNQPIHTWYGVSVNVNGCVSGLDLDGNISSCTTCSDGGNNLSGTIPTSLFTLSDLTSLSIDDAVAGTLASIGQLQKLQFLRIDGNLSGTIPTEIGQLTDLKYLLLYNNPLSGELPASINNLSNLSWLRISNSNITGSIPYLGNLSSLEILELSKNELNGPIPSWLEELDNVYSLSLSNNNFTGNIPRELGNMAKLDLLQLDRNQLSGSIPAELTNAPNLIVIELSNNRLSGSIPDLSALNLQVLFLDNNQLEGDFPLWFAEESTFTQVSLAYNNLEGTVPNFTSTSRGLITFHLVGNRFTFSDILPSYQNIYNLIKNNNQQAEPNFSIAPQQDFGEPITLQKEVGESLTMDLGIDAAVASNVYTWYKDGQFYTSIAGNNQLTIAEVETANQGIYYCIVTNPSIPDLELRSRNFTVQITGQDPISADTDIFNAFTWLTFITTPTTCSTEKITIYQTGAYKYLLVDTGSEAKLYSETGQLYCTNSADYDCVVAYGLTEVVATWACGSEETDDGSTSDNDNDNADDSSDDNNDSSTSNSVIFDTYSWLRDFINSTTCEAGSITVYQTGSYKYLLVDTGSEAKLYNESGQLYCTNSANYDCASAYGLTEIIDTWTCGSGATNNEDTDNESTENNDDNNNDSSTSNPTIFDTYTWLSDFMNPTNCEVGSIIVYQTGAYKYLLVDTGSEAKLYNESGQLYCTNSANYDCAAAYSLTEIIDTWTCGSGATNDGGSETTTDNMNEGDNNSNTADSAIFDTYTWLNDLVHPAMCEDATVTVYQKGAYQYLLVYDSSGGKLYNESGQLYCTNTSSYDCVTAYGLMDVIDIWSCNPNNSIFATYTWLRQYVIPNSCNKDITVYQSRDVKFVFIDNEYEPVLYNEVGYIVCVGSAEECVAASNLTEVVETWTCNNGFQQPITQRFATKSVDAASMQLFPNPATENVFIQLLNTEQATQLSLIDMTGRILKTLTITDRTVEWDVRDLSSGLYLVQWRTGSVFETIRLIVE